jgi:ABC-type bacteriocin/lantibiotic exporter with double-glycine peptidase domain
MTGVRIGIMLQALSATITALAIAFSAGWKLTLVIICFIPLMLLTGIFQGRKQSNIAKAKNKSSLTEQGGQVETN